MLAVRGTYKNGRVVIKEGIKTDKPVSVIVTFLEDVKTPIVKKLDLSKFSFRKSKELLADYRGSLSDAVIEERRSAV